MAIIFNPIEGKFEVKQRAAQQAAYVAEEYACDPALNVGDIALAKEDGTGVVKAVDNEDVRLAIGICIRKPSSTRAIVLCLGVQDGFSGLEIGKAVLLSKTGGLTQDRSQAALGPGWQHALGQAVTGSKIFFMITAERTWINV
jgi:hypothetical protein